jgi:arylsulfatase A-like enzyme
MTGGTPNVVLIHSHDLGRHVGCYGRSLGTPNLDSLAAEGAVFENHFVAAPQCSPSRGSLHTGRYPHENGLMGLAHHGWSLDADVDVLPTVLDLVDGAEPGDVDGRSFLALATGQEYLPRQQVFAEMTWHDQYNPMRAVRTDRYKYIRNCWHLPEVTLTNDVFASEAGRDVREAYYVSSRPYEELYDLESDPHERENVAGDPAYEPIRAELERRLVDWMRRTEDPLLDGPIPPADMEEIEPW